MQGSVNVCLLRNQRKNLCQWLDKRTKGHYIVLLMEASVLRPMRKQWSAGGAHALVRIPTFNGCHKKWCGIVLKELIIHIMKIGRLFILYGASKGWYFEWKKRNNKGNERIEENILYMDFKFLDGKIWI